VARTGGEPVRGQFLVADRVGSEKKKRVEINNRANLKSLVHLGKKHGRESKKKKGAQQGPVGDKKGFRSSTGQEPKKKETQIVGSGSDSFNTTYSTEDWVCGMP